MRARKDACTPEERCKTSFKTKTHSTCNTSSIKLCRQAPEERSCSAHLYFFLSLYEIKALKIPNAATSTGDCTFTGNRNASLPSFVQLKIKGDRGGGKIKYRPSLIIYLFIYLFIYTSLQSCKKRRGNTSIMPAMTECAVAFAMHGFSDRNSTPSRPCYSLQS